MSLSRYYLVLVGVTLIIMSGAFLLLKGSHPDSLRDPADALWMERIRRSTMESVAPLRDRLIVSCPQYGFIRMDGVQVDEPVRVEMNEADRLLALEIISSAKHSIVDTSEWVDGEPYTAPDSEGRSKKLFDTKDSLWDTSIKFLDLLWLVYSREGVVMSSELIGIESQLDMYMRLLDDEFFCAGLGRVE